MTGRTAPLSRDRRGVSAVEFAILAPAMIALITGLGDLLYQGYVQAMLQGAVVKAGRDSSLENNAGDQSAIDARVRSTMGMLGKGVSVSMQRSSYANFALVKPETFDDKNKNGVRDAGECFDDVNGNKKWDADPGNSSQGGANDVTRYTVTVTYNRLFPVSKLIGWSGTQTAVASTLLKNQPYKTQAPAPIESVCS